MWFDRQKLDSYSVNCESRSGTDGWLQPFIRKQEEGSLSGRFLQESVLGSRFACYSGVEQERTNSSFALYVTKTVFGSKLQFWFFFF